ncbi:MAG: TonB family protein [Armatimonadota bacterium]|nr:TonB family protein [Armatimonadota bacterium]
MGEKGVHKAFGISAAVHLLAIAVIGHISVRALSTPRQPSHGPKFINVDLIDLPAKVAPKPTEAPKVSLPSPTPIRNFAARSVDESVPQGEAVRSETVAATRVQTQRPRQALSGSDSAGGKLDMGSTSSSGDLPGNWGGGKTPVGWVPDPADGSGKGSGHNPGVGTPEPVRSEEPNRAASQPPPRDPEPPKPAFVSVRVCSESGLLPGPYCKTIETRSFPEGRQPGRICDKCQPPHTSRLADRAEPQLVQDSRVSVPSSIPEGLTLRVEIQYTITAEGDVTDICIVKSSGYKALDSAIVTAASRMKYKPAVQDGIPRSVKRIRTYTINT